MVARTGWNTISGSRQEQAPEAINMKFEGASKIEISDQADLIIKTTAGNIVEHKPTIYQDILHGRKVVAGRYKLNADQTVGFELGEYDRTKRWLSIPPSSTRG